MYDKREIYRHVSLRLQTDYYDTRLNTWKSYLLLYLFIYCFKAILKFSEYADELRKSVRTCEKILATPLGSIMI